MATARPMMTFEVTNKGTIYRVHRVDALHRRFWLVMSGFGNNYGEWIEVHGDTIAWSYLAEKMPRMARLDGDKPGWIMVFAKAGLEVFG